MASYVESATLKVIDQASGPLKAINATLKEVQRTAQGLARTGQSLGRSFRIGAVSGDLGRVKTELDAVRRAMSQLGSARANVRFDNIGANFSRATASANQFASALAQINRQMSQYRSASAGSMRFPNPPRLPVPYNNNQIGPSNRGWFGQRGFNPNASLADRVQNRIVNQAEQALSAGFESSGAARDYGRLLFPKEPEVQKKAEQFAAQVSSEFKSIPIGTILKTWYETAAQVKDPNSPAVNSIVREMLATGIGAQMQGGNAKQSVDGMMKLVKSANLRGDLTTATGDIDVDSTTKFLEAVRRAQNVVGRELPHESVFQAIKYARTQRGAIDYDMLGHLLFMAGDIGGSSAGVGLSSFVNQLTGTATKQAMANQAKAGLIAGGIDENNPAGPKKFAYSGTTDAELLQENPRMWIAKHFMGPNGVLARAGLDPRTATAGDVNNVIKPMFSNRVAADFLTNMITQFQEYENSKARALKSAYKANDILGVADASQRNKLFAVSGQLESAFGELTEKLKFAINPALDAAGAVLNKLTPSNVPGEGMKSSLLGGLLGIAGAGAVGGGLLGKFIAEHPGIAAGAAAQIGAAGALTAAAAALSGAAGKLGLGSLVGAAGAGGVAKATTAAATVATQASIAAKAATVAGSALKWLGIAGAGVATVTELTNLSKDKTWADNLGVGLSAAKQAAIGGLMFTLPPAGAVIALGDMFGKAAADSLKQVQKDIKDGLREQKDAAQAAQDAARDSGKFDANDMPISNTQDAARRKTGRTFETPEERQDREKREIEAIVAGIMQSGGLSGPWRPLAPGQFGPPVPPLYNPQSDPALRDIIKGIWETIRNAIITPANGSELPPGATLDSPTGGAVPAPGTGADLQAVLSDSVFSISSAMESAGRGVETAAGTLAGSLSMASEGVGSAGGSLVGAINSLAGQISSIHIQAPSVSAPANTGTNAAVVR